MAYVGTSTSGKILTATGDAAGSTFLSLGVRSGLTANGVVIAQDNAAFTATGAGGIGQVLTSNGFGFDPSFQSITPGIFPWTDETGAKTMFPNNGYTTSSLGATVVLTLPVTCAYGSLFRIVGNTIAGWEISQNAGQQIHFGSQNTTRGVLGSLQSTGQYDAIEILCTIANTDFTVINGPEGNITVN